ncbi:MAG TPA: GDP-mannose 4,6-dehydratase, partial [Nitrosarchaeum sp.]|nr:GDP-mannose 4,6-dehydratase [Nitrosarchaeum sp.]
MKVLVTGGLGFIGSNFILRLLKNHKDIDVINIDAEFFGSNHKNIQDVKNSTNYKFIPGNITDNNIMKKLISDSDVIVNFAAESFVDRSISNAEPFLESNIKGVFTILEIIKNQKKKMIHVSTDEVYGSLEIGSAIETSRF